MICIQCCETCTNVVFFVTGLPSSPQNLHVVNTDSGSISLEWTPSKETAVTPVHGYTIEMAVGDSKDFVEMAKVHSGTSKFDATGLKDGEKYNFRIKAENQIGSSSDGAQLASPVAAAAPPPGEKRKQRSMKPIP